MAIAKTLLARDDIKIDQAERLVSFMTIPTSATSKQRHVWQGDTALHWAARQGNLEVAKLLLEKGCDPNIKNEVRVAWLCVFRAFMVMRRLNALLLGEMDCVRSRYTNERQTNTSRA